MFSKRSPASAAGPPQTDSKRRFSLFRGAKEAVVTILPVEDSPNSAIGSSLECLSSNSLTDTTQPPDLLPPLPPLLSRHPRPDSVLSSLSGSSDDMAPTRHRASSALGQVPEREEVASPDLEGLPTYASAVHPTIPVTYGFSRCSPFAMVVTPDGGGSGSGLGLYHVSVGVNIWMPSSTVTTIRRGPTEGGPIVAELEMGVSAVPATVTMGGVCRQLNQVYFRKSTSSSSRLYFTGDGATIKWKLGVNSWQATLDSTTLASFTPAPPRKLTLQPAGHRLSDHIIVSLVILMREHLTPLAGMRGDSAQLFNYSPHHNYQEE